MCSVPGCWHAIPRNRLLCAAHWAHVPKVLQKRITEEYDEWRRTGDVPKTYPGNVKAAIQIAGGKALADPSQLSLPFEKKP